MNATLPQPAQAWLNNTLMNVKLTYRDRQTIFWTYLFPLFFMFLFAGVFARGQARMVTTMMAGLLCISAMSNGFFGLSISLVAQRQRGILRRYRLAPLSPLTVLSSELASNFVVLLSTLILQLVLARLFYHLQIAGSLVLLFVMLSLGGLVFLALGFIIASVADNPRAAQVISNLCFFPLLFLGGAAFPLEFLPKGLQNVARLLPSQYMVEGLRLVLVVGAGWRTVLPYVTVLLLALVSALALAVKLFRWDAHEPLPWRQKLLAAAPLLVFVGAYLLLRT